MSSGSDGYGASCSIPTSSPLRTVPWHRARRCASPTSRGRTLRLGRLVRASVLLAAAFSRLEQRGWTATRHRARVQCFRDIYEQSWRKSSVDLEPANYYKRRLARCSGLHDRAALIRRPQKKASTPMDRLAGRQNIPVECLAITRSTSTTSDGAESPPTTHASTERCPRRSRRGRACRSATSRSARSRKAATSTSTSPCRMRPALCSGATARRSSRSWPVSLTVCAS